MLQQILLFKKLSIHDALSLPILPAIKYNGDLLALLILVNLLQKIYQRFLCILTGPGVSDVFLHLDHNQLASISVTPIQVKFSSVNCLQC